MVTPPLLLLYPPRKDVSKIITKGTSLPGYLNNSSSSRFKELFKLLVPECSRLDFNHQGLTKSPGLGDGGRGVLRGITANWSNCGGGNKKWGKIRQPGFPGQGAFLSSLTFQIPNSPRPWPLSGTLTINKSLQRITATANSASKRGVGWGWWPPRVP